jgi:hypothetical protein
MPKITGIRNDQKIEKLKISIVYKLDILRKLDNGRLSKSIIIKTINAILIVFLKAKFIKFLILLKSLLTLNSEV